MPKILIFIVLLSNYSFTQYPLLNWVEPINNAGIIVRLDRFENIYCTGLSSDNDLFITKYDTLGNLLWEVIIEGEAHPTDLKTDSNGDLIITGSFWNSIDFDPGFGSCVFTANVCPDIFWLKLDSLGQYIWAKKVGADYIYENSSEMDIDSMGNIYTTGSFYGTVDFDPDTSSVYNLTSYSDENDVFIIKLDANGAFMWAHSLGSYANDYSTSITIDKEENLYISGQFSGLVDFDPGPAVHQLNGLSQSFHGFILKLTSTGEFIWVHELKVYEINEISTDNSNNVYLTGLFQGEVDFDPGTNSFFLESIDRNNAFLSKLDADGNFIWAKQILSNEFSNGKDIQVDSLNNLYLSGEWNGVTDLNPGLTTDGILENNGNDNSFLIKLDENGNYKWGTPITSTVFQSTDVSSNGTIYLMGYYDGTVDFDPQNTVYELTSSSATYFLCRLIQGDIPENQVNTIDLAEKNGDLLLYPNPFSENLYIVTSEISDLCIRDLFGNTLYSSKITQGINTVNLKDITTGIYFVDITSDYGMKQIIICKL